MVLLGSYNSLTISRISAIGAHFHTDSGEVVLPQRLVPQGAGQGDTLKVFVYVDSEGRLTATTRTPSAVADSFAVLAVKETTTVGSFLDWGLEKDLLLPFGEQLEPVRRGDKVLVRVFVHDSGRVVASARIEKFLRPVDNSLQEKSEVELLVYAYSDLGAKVVINGLYGGLVFNSELLVKPAVGEQLRGFVKRIREDGKIDVSLRRSWAEEAVNDRQCLLDALNKGGGFLPLTDKSAPDEIAATVRLSKKSFKKALGGLYKEGLVTIAEQGITLITVGSK